MQITDGNQYRLWENPEMKWAMWADPVPSIKQDFRTDLKSMEEEMKVRER